MKHDEFEFFRTANGHISYNSKCKQCKQDCKQSFRVEILRCPKYADKNYERKIQ